MKKKWKNDQTIINEIGMAELPKLFDIFYTKYKGQYRLINIGTDCMFRFGETNLANVSYLAVFLHFFEIKDEILKIEGNVSWPSVISDFFKLIIECNGEKHYVDIYNANMDLCYENGKAYECRSAFAFKMKVCKNVDYRIKFIYECNGIQSYCGKINAMRFFPVADILKKQYCKIDNKILYIEGSTLIIKNATIEEFDEREKNFCEEVNQVYKDYGKWIIDLRKKYFSTRKKKPIWLFMDRPDKADDNAEILFKYMQNNKEIDSYFVISKESPDYERIKEYGNIIDLYSEEHYLKYLSSDYIISSQCNGVVENPFWDKSEPLRDIYHNPKIIFLQHGVIKDDMSSTLNRFNTNFYGFITSNVNEYNSILEYDYFYSSNEVWNTGLPLFDELTNDSQNVILFVPTWRKYYMHQEWDDTTDDMHWIANKEFEKSNFVKHYRSIFENKKFINKCKQKGYRIAVKLHPLLQPYSDVIVRNSDIEIWNSKSYREAMAEAKLLVTDYSSVAMEFSFLRKSICYYQFDKQEFLNNHTYKPGYFDYEIDGFGPVVTKEKKLINEIYSSLDCNCRIDYKYLTKMEIWDSLANGKCCEKIYNKMTGGEL